MIETLTNLSSFQLKEPPLVYCTDSLNEDRGWGADMNQGLATGISHNLIRGSRESKQLTRLIC